MNSPATSRPPLLLAHSYYLVYDEKQMRKMKPYAPLGTLLTAAFVRARGHEVALFDFLTKMCTLRMRRAALEMIQMARSRGCLVIVNGSDATDRPDLYLDAGALAVILGEVEQTFAELADVLAAGPARADGTTSRAERRNPAESRTT